MKSWYWFKRGGWEIAVDAISLKDARQHIARSAPGAIYQGEALPPSWAAPSMATAMVTPRRQEIIHETIERQDREFRLQGF